ncbi:MAG: hypothetical protein KF703_05080 [Actinobacteria bacterium]|nr:hypothetical protein [Actinomycetota bacterium]
MCATVSADVAATLEASPPAPTTRGRRGRRRRSPCDRCGHPMRLHGPGSGHAPVVVAPLPIDLPTVPTPAPEPDVADPIDEPPPAPIEADPAAVVAGAALDDPPAPAAPTSGELLVERIRALTELYRSGMLDDEEFAAAKALVLRDQTP